MTHEIDIQRVRGELKWDGLEQTAFGKVLQFPTKSAMRIADLADVTTSKVSKPWSREDIETVTTWAVFALVIFALAVGARVL